ncbi:hypothetical protein [Sphingomonas turrisvirgatae]|nr:hypothetical protein [Sphingomonas turrisvirgatae]
MKTIGIIMWVGGLVLAGFAGLFFDTSVGGYGRIISFDLQQKQLMMLIAGCVLFAVGVVLHALSGKLQAPKPPASKKGPSKPNGARIAHALDLGVMDTGKGYAFEGKAYADIEDAIRAADPAKRWAN